MRFCCIPRSLISSAQSGTDLRREMRFSVRVLAPERSDSGPGETRGGLRWRGLLRSLGSESDR